MTAEQLQQIQNAKKGGQKMLRVMTKPNGNQQVGGQAPSLVARGSNPGRGTNAPPSNPLTQIAKQQVRYKCYSCPKSYVHKQAMERHYVEHHKGVIMSANGTTRAG